MPEINLPTKSTQDAIKATTDSIKTNTDGVKAKTDLIGAANPSTAGTDTIMNYLKKLDAKTTGTDVFTGTPKTAGGYFSITSGSTTPYTLLSATGKGVIKGIMFKSRTSYFDDGTLKVTIDNVDIYNGTLGNFNAQSGGVFIADFPFKTSCKISITAGSDGITGQVLVSYVLY